MLSLGERILEFDPRGPSARVLRAHQSFVYYVTFSPDGSILASTGWQEDGTNAGGPPDFDGDGMVGVVDFLDLLAHRGPCA